MNQNLLAGNPTKIDFFYIYPWKLKNIVNPELRYYEHLFLFFITVEDLGFPAEINKSYNLLELVRARAVIGEAFRNQVLEALYAFTNEKFMFINEEFVLNGNILTFEHWLNIKQILSEENFLNLETAQVEEFNPGNERAIEFRRRIEETRKLVKKYKKKDDVNLGFLINRFCAKSFNINIRDVWDLTLYQFKQQLDALIVNETYDFNMMALANGNLNPKKYKIVHWTENK